jgi:hypothetical protein
VGLYVSTTGTDVEIPELGFTLTHPSTDYALSDQFSYDDIKNASTLTTKILDGSLLWKKTSGGATETSANYDPDLLEAEALNTGTGYEGDRLVSFKDLNSSTLPTKSGSVAPASFSGNPKKYAVVFATPFSSTSYEIHITGADSRGWSWESKTASGFTINANANQALTGNVDWSAIFSGETL